MQKMQSIRAFLDRVEGDTAILLLGEEESVRVELPLKWLPDGVREGVVLRLDASIDAAGTEEGKRKVQSLYDSIPNEP